MMNKLWVFDKNTLNDIITTTKNIQDTEKRINAIISLLNKYYPGKINKDINFFWTRAGGGMWYVCLLHISTMEYLMITGNASGTIGHSGRNFVSYTDYVIDGNMQYSYENKPYFKEKFKRDDCIYTSVFSAISYNTKDGVSLLEYCRGPILSLFPFGTLDTLFSTMDYWSLLKGFYNIGKWAITHLGEFFYL